MNMYRFHSPALIARTRKGLFAALGLGGLGVLALGLMLAWSGMQQTAALQDRIARAAALPEEDAGTEGVFLAAESPNIAQTRLQTHIQDIGAAHKLEIEVIRSDEMEDQGRALALGIMLNGVIPEAELAGFLGALSTAEPKVLVSSLDLRAARVTSRRDPTRKIALRMGLKGMMLK